MKRQDNRERGEASSGRPRSCRDREMERRVLESGVWRWGGCWTACVGDTNGVRFLHIMSEE
jgi:hypothetical protein